MIYRNVCQDTMITPQSIVSQYISAVKHHITPYLTPALLQLPLTCPVARVLDIYDVCVVGTEGRQTLDVCQFQHIAVCV